MNQNHSAVGIPLGDGRRLFSGFTLRTGLALFLALSTPSSLFSVLRGIYPVGGPDKTGLSVALAEAPPKKAPKKSPPTRKVSASKSGSTNRHVATKRSKSRTSSAVASRKNPPVQQTASNRRPARLIESGSINSSTISSTTEAALRGRMRSVSDPSRPPPLDTVSVAYEGNLAYSEKIPSMESRFSGRIVATTQQGEFIYYSFDPQLQDYVEGLVRASRDNHLAIVAMEPMTGRVLALAGHSVSLPDPVFHNRYPAASLFKVVTAAAAVEHASVTPDHLIAFRGGNYTLERSNFRPDSRRDTRTMSIGEALGRSVNPVFGRIALLDSLSPRIIGSVARDFGFNWDLQSDVPVPISHAIIPSDEYELARTGAGFGAVTISPIHAASMVSGVANGGNLLRPIFIDKVLSPTGALRYRSRPKIISRMLSEHAAQTVFAMMENTTSIGTGRRAFISRGQPVFPHIPIAAKTGTLNGSNPEGLTRWFIAVAPRERPQIAIAVVAVHPGGPRGNPSLYGRQILGRFFGE
jgi:peptidoglycan glycosyltransferase